MKPNDTRQVSAFDEICISCRFFTGTECNQRKGLRKKLSIKSIPSISKRKVSNNDFYLLRSLREKSLFRTEISNKRRSIRLYSRSHRGKASSLQEMRGKDRNPPRFLKPAG